MLRARATALLAAVGACFAIVMIVSQVTLLRSSPSNTPSVRGAAAAAGTAIPSADAAAMRDLAGLGGPPWCAAPAAGGGRRVHIAIILPTTSKGVPGSGPLTSKNILRRLPLVGAFWRSLIKTVAAFDSRFCYTAYLGVNVSDAALLLSETWDVVEAAFHASVTPLGPRREAVPHVGWKRVVYSVRQQHLVDMYNGAAMAAYDDGADYFYTMNDDVALLTPGWSEALVGRLEASPVRPGFGVTGPNELMWCATWGDGAGCKDNCTQYPFVHRSHLDFMGGLLYDPSFISFGLDVWICGLYAAMGGAHAQALLPDVHVLNHVANAYDAAHREPEELKLWAVDMRYDVPENWRAPIQPAIDRAVAAMRSYWPELPQPAAPPAAAA